MPEGSPLPLGEGKGEGRFLPPELLRRCRELRRHVTDAERLLWRLLRRRQLKGAKFRRQHPMAPYILDFYCLEAKVAVELDGGEHADEHRTNLDEGRRCDLEGRGIRVLRFWNHAVLQNTEGVLQAIWEALPSAYPHPDPLPEGEGGPAPAATKSRLR